MRIQNTYDKESFIKLQSIVDKTVANATKRHDLRNDTKIFTPAVCRRGKLRFDLRLPEKSVAPITVSQNISSIISAHLGKEYKTKGLHCLVAFAGAEAQDWHTDVDPLFEDETHPPFYFTLITALDDVTEEMGPTEFEDNSKALLKRNESILFDGLVVHRGGAALIDRPPLVYQVFHKRWYCDANEKGL